MNMQCHEKIPGTIYEQYGKYSICCAGADYPGKYHICRAQEDGTVGIMRGYLNLETAREYSKKECARDAAPEMQEALLEALAYLEDDFPNEVQNNWPMFYKIKQALAKAAGVIV
jgi:hypothetical protein